MPQGTSPRPFIRRIIAVSFGFSFALLAAIFIVAMTMTGTADAATYQTATAGPANWTGGGSWSCTAPGAPGSTLCGLYPGDPAAGGAANGDVANIVNGITLTVNSAIANGVTVNITGANAIVNVTTGGSLQLAGASALSQGTMQVSGGALTIPSGASLATNAVAAVPTANVQLSSGTINNGGTININGGSTFATSMTWSGGSIIGPGTTNINTNLTNASLSLSGAAGVMTLDTGQLFNFASTNDSSAANALVLANGATFHNSGTFTVNGAAPVNSSGTPGAFLNSGTFTKAAGGPTVVNVPFSNTGLVTMPGSLLTIDLHEGGTHSNATWTLAGNTLNFAGSTTGHTFNNTQTFNGPGQVNFTGGTISVNTNMTIPVALTNNAALNFGATPHTLTVSGNYTQGGSLAVKLNGTTAGTQYDQLNVSGTASLAGGLSATLGYAPADGDFFNVLTYASHTGTLTYTPVPYANGFINDNYLATALQLVAAPDADISLLKTGPATALHGQNVTYTVKVGNLGPSPATSVVISDSFTNASFVSASVPGGTCTGTGPISCTIPTLANGASAFITVVLNANTIGTLTNNASVSSTSPVDLNSANDTSSAATTVSASADLAIAKTDAPDPVVANGTLTYTVTVTNNGPDLVSNFSVVDALPAGVTFVSATGPVGWSCSFSSPNVNCTWTSTGLLPTQSTAATIVVTAPAAGGTITNNAQVSSPTGDPVSTNNTTSAVTTVLASADLSITKTGPGTATAGFNAVFTTTVTNNGPSTATGVTVNDVTPPGMTFISNSGACTGPFPCALGNFAANSSATITSVYKVASSATGSITNTASVSSTSSDPISGNDSSSATVTVIVSTDVSVNKVITSTLTAGSNVTYSLVVQNSGPSDATGVVVNDPTPAGLTFVSNAGACTTPFPCALGTMTAGSGGLITTTYAVAPTATGTISNTATVSSTTPDPNSLNNSSTATGTVGTNSDLAITKTGPASANAGQTVSYTITVTNNGPSTATGVVVNDPTPAGTTAVSVSGPCTSFPCTIGTMAPGASVTITATYTINTTTTGAVTNTATVTATSTDPISTNNSASVTTTIAGQADLQIVKTGPNTLPPGGGSISFTLTIKNLGPGTATSIVVNDSPSSGMTFVSNTGACTTPFPCTIASLASGAIATIQSTFSVPANLQRASNTADVSSSTTPDPNPSNNTSSVVLGSGCAGGSIVQFAPFSGQADAPVAGLVQWTAVGNATYDVYLGPAGSGCTTLLASNVSGNSVAYAGLTPNTDYESRIVASRGNCPAIASQCIRWRTGAGPCSLSTPVITAPAAGANVGSPATLKWNAVAGADRYHVVVMNGATIVTDTTTPDTSLEVSVPNGAITWSVTALSGQNCTSPAANAAFNVCSPPDAPLAGVVGAPTSGRTYSVIVVNPSVNNVRYEFQEARNESFSDAVTLTSSSPTEAYTHTGNSAQVFFYRVRAFVACTTTPGPYSKTIRVVIVPPQVNRINVPAGSKELVVVQVQVPGEQTPVNFTASSIRPWVVKIDPSSGILPPAGLVLNVTLDPGQLPNGTFTTSIVITTSPLTSSGRIATNDSKKSVPVTINLVTPVVPNNPSGPTADSLIIPAVGHLAGLNSQWRSDIRIYNASPQTLQYLLNFTPQGSSDVKQTTITTASSDTTALDDIIHNWFGVGEVGDSSTGVLEIRPMTLDGSTTPPKGSSFTTVASSRTFSEASQGTVGQFIPPVKFTNFIGSGAKLSMQQLSQNASYRTNFGLVEASGAPVSLMLTMFSSAGSKLFELPVNLAGGEQKLLNGLIGQQGQSNLLDGRMEVSVIGGNGKITAYASVVDNQSLDPQLVPGQTLGNTSSRLYVVPGVADLNNGVASWRTDLRVYNSSSTPQTANLTFFGQDNATQPLSAAFTVNPGEVKVLDNVLQSLFATHDVGGMVQVTTPTDSQLVVTGRTYNQTSTGTLGQFIKAATAADGITTATRALNVLQVEDSPRFRTNLGLAEMSGRPATVEVSVILPDSKITPTIQVPLSANEFRQFSVGQFGLGDIYNARVSVKVVDGQGSVTAYGSVIDQVTTDPTYVQAQ